MDSHTIAELAAHSGGELFGNGDTRVDRVSGLEDADERCVVFIDDPRMISRAVESGAACIISPRLDQSDLHVNRIEVRNPKLAFTIVAALLHPARALAAGVHDTAVIAPTAQIDPSAHIGAHVYVDEHAVIGANAQLHSGVRIGARVQIGERCVLYPNVVVYEDVVMGNRVIVHAGAVIGADGFGYVRGPDGYVKFPQIGSVVIEDDVEIGANACIDRGALATTRIGRGSKIDNLCMVAHNVQMGARVIMAGQSGISGSTSIGNDVVLAGQVGLSDHVTVENGVQIGAKSAVFPGKVIPAGAVVMGIPARPIDRYKNVTAQLSRLPQLRAELTALRKEVERLARLAADVEKSKPAPTDG